MRGYEHKCSCQATEGSDSTIACTYFGEGRALSADSLLSSDGLRFEPSQALVSGLAGRPYAGRKKGPSSRQVVKLFARASRSGVCPVRTWRGAAAQCRTQDPATKYIAVGTERPRLDFDAMTATSDARGGVEPAIILVRESENHTHMESGAHSLKYREDGEGNTGTTTRYINSQGSVAW